MYIIGPMFRCFDLFHELERTIILTICVFGMMSTSKVDEDSAKYETRSWNDHVHTSINFSHFHLIKIAFKDKLIIYTHLSEQMHCSLWLIHLATYQGESEAFKLNTTLDSCCLVTKQVKMNTLS